MDSRAFSAVNGLQRDSRSRSARGWLGVRARSRRRSNGKGFLYLAADPPIVGFSAPAFLRAREFPIVLSLAVPE
jgi:hypothetical protein